MKGEMDMKEELVWFGVLVDGEYCWFSWGKDLLELYDDDIVWEEEFDVWVYKVMKAKEVNKYSMSPCLDRLPKNEKVSGNFRDIMDAYNAWEEWDLERMEKWGIKFGEDDESILKMMERETFREIEEGE